MKVLKAKELTSIMESFEVGYMGIANRPTHISRKTLKSKNNSLKQNGKPFKPAEFSFIYGDQKHTMGKFAGAAQTEWLSTNNVSKIPPTPFPIKLRPVLI